VSVPVNSIALVSEPLIVRVMSPLCPLRAGNKHLAVKLNHQVSNAVTIVVSQGNRLCLSSNLGTVGLSFTVFTSIWLTS
jgi:hypothetical protein